MKTLYAINDPEIRTKTHFVESFGLKLSLGLPTSSHKDRENGKLFSCDVDSVATEHTLDSDGYAREIISV